MTLAKPLGEGFFVSGQLTPTTLQAAPDMGVRTIVNNRPDGESTDQTPGADIEAAARALGIGYQAIAVDHSGFNHAQIEQLWSLIDQADGAIWAYCRSGMRSTALWALAMARYGTLDIAEIVGLAAGAGYEISGLEPQLRALRDEQSA